MVQSIMGKRDDLRFLLVFASEDGLGKRMNKKHKHIIYPYLSLVISKLLPPLQQKVTSLKSAKQSSVHVMGFLNNGLFFVSCTYILRYITGRHTET